MRNIFWKFPNSFQNCKQYLKTTIFYGIPKLYQFLTGFKKNNKLNKRKMTKTCSALVQLGDDLATFRFLLGQLNRLRIEKKFINFENKFSWIYEKLPALKTKFVNLRKGSCIEKKFKYLKTKFANLRKCSEFWKVHGFNKKNMV